MKEKLSAFIDAELSELEERHLLTALGNDAELRSTWERYHLIRAAMTRQLSLLAPAGLSERVARALGETANERDGLRFWHYAGGVAVAASVMALAIIGLQALNEPAAPTSPVATAATDIAPESAATSVPSSAQGLNPYLVGHNEFMPTAGMGGMLPYVRVVTLEPDK